MAFNDLQLHVAASRGVRRPHQPWLFAAWMAVAAAVSVVAGLGLGILAALQAGYAEGHWTEAVQAHGRLQLWGFAGVFIVTLSYEFIARMNARPLFPVRLRAGVPGALVLGALLMAAGQLWHNEVGVLGVFGALLLLAGSLAFAWTVIRVRPPHSLKLDPQPWFFWLGSVWLVASAALTLALALNWEQGVSSPVESHTAAEIFLRGFVLQVILAVAPRAMAGHLGLPHLSARHQFLLLAAVNGGTLAWLLGQDVWVLPGLSALVRLGDVTLGASLIALTWWLRILARGRPRAARYEWILPIAWLGAVVYAVMLVAEGFSNADLTLYQEGATRHVFLLGFMLPLMIGMAHIVLERFGTGEIPNVNLLTAAFVLAMVAWPFRVLPALPSDSPGDAAQGLMALAGMLTMLSLGFTAFVCARTAAATRAPLQVALHRLPA